MKFTCASDDGELVVIEADEPQEAARELAERLHAQDPSDSYSIALVDEEGVHYDATVDVEIEVSFFAMVTRLTSKGNRKRKAKR